MDMWGALQYVGSGLSLVAFAVAAILLAYRARLTQRAEIIKSAPENEQLEAIATTAEFFRVDVSRLSRAQQEGIVLAQIHARARRDLSLAGVSLAVAILLAAIALAAIWVGRAAGPTAVVNPSGPVFAPAHDVVFSGTMNFVLSEKQFDELKAIVELAELRDQISELKALVRQLAASRPGATAPDHDQAIASAVAATQQGAQQPRLGPYTNSELEAAQAKYEPFLRGLFFEDLLARLPHSMHAPLGQVQLNLPAEMPAALGADPAFVLNVGAVPTSRQVFLPLRTVVWLDQYFGLIAHLERRKCPDRLVIALVYAGMLTSSGQGGVRPPGPFAAFGLDDSIYRDAFVKDVSNKLFGSNLFFLLAHELGHIARGHTAGVSGINSQLQEREADVYALDAMATVGLMPLNLALFFSAAAMMEGGQTTHPLSGSRVEEAARAIEARPRAFVRLQPSPSSWLPRMLGLARQVREAIPLADDPERRAEVLRAVGAADFTELRSVHERLCPQ